MREQTTMILPWSRTGRKHGVSHKRERPINAGISQFILRSIIILILLSTLPLSFAANDPGHDTLYIEVVGQQNLTGSFNISDWLRVANLMYSNYLDILGNGTQPTGSYAQIYTPSVGTQLVLNAPTSIWLAKDSGSMVHVGDGSAVVLNVSGDIYSGGELVCLADGTNCVGGNQTGNVTSIIAGNGISVDQSTGNVTVSTSATSCGGNEYSYWSGTGWNCRTDADSGTLDEATVESYIYDASNALGAQWTITSDGSYDINFDSNTFVVDASEGKVGIGTTTPSSKFEVNGTVELTNLYDNDGSTFFDGGACAYGISNIDSTGAFTCASAQGSDGTGGWTNTSTTTRSSLNVNLSAGNLTLEGSGQHLILPLESDASTPTLSFGDGDSGFYETSDDRIQFVSGGTDIVDFTSGRLSMGESNGAAMMRETPSSTNPVFTFLSDEDTGMSRAGADNLSLIAGGAEVMRLNGSGVYVSDSKVCTPANGLCNQTASSGGVEGSGANTRIAYWNATDSITSTAGFTFNGTALAVPGNINATSDICISGGNCLTSMATDQVGAVSDGQWCRGDGALVQCDQSAPDTSSTNEIQNLTEVLSEGNSAGSSNIDMNSQLIQNIGTTGTDFTSGGGLTLAGTLAVTGAGTHTIAGSLNVVSNSLFVNGSSVGIGTAQPNSTLHVVGNVNVTGADNCIYLPNGGSLCGNSTCIYLTSPDGGTTVETCN